MAHNFYWLATPEGFSLHARADKYDPYSAACAGSVRVGGKATTWRVEAGGRVKNGRAAHASGAQRAAMRAGTRLWGG
mgnify:CR=1 FL=1